MAIVPRMTRPERRSLIRMGRRSGDVQTALRFEAVARLAQGLSSGEVAERLELARSTVIRAGRRYVEDGCEGLYDQRRGNGSVKANDDFAARVAELLQRTPEDWGWSRPTWTRELLCLQMSRDGWPAVAVCTMGRVLSRIGARLGTPRPFVVCPWPRDARKQALQWIRQLERYACASEPVLYADEVDIHLNPKIGRDWMLRGQQRRVRTPGANEKFYLAGALDMHSGRLHTVGAASKNAALFCDLVQLLARRYPRARKIHVILDNYVIHSARRTQEQLRQLDDRVVLHFLPPYCPEANRIERVWQDLHANVTRNHRCKTMEELLGKVRAYLTAYIRGHVTGLAAAKLAA